ncbi:hypothetical protein MIR68_010873 [Amoeboaphelidium protococcarum]|nr:hypothetical protein MIR68_010873 [Amoeboaphelidium protococcarum]KAI3642114.1 hypothetical protein MP228_011669 [Amoeboaphelidium protococcarum]
MNEDQQQEIEVLQSIYAPEELQVAEDNRIIYRLHLNAQQQDGSVAVLIEIEMPQDYPSESAPKITIRESFNCPVKWLTSDKDFMQRVNNDLQQRYTDTKSSIIYDWIEYLREQLQSRLDLELSQQDGDLRQWLDRRQTQSSQNQVSAATGVLNNDHSLHKGDEAMKAINYIDSEAQKRQTSIKIVSSEEPIVDRKSIFVAHMARISNKDQIAQVLDTLLQNSKIRKASHNIVAYRIDNVDYGYDDDGEGGAGIRLLSMLESGGYVKVVVIVSRWFGGTHLGSDRFKHISNSAKQLLQKEYK